MARTATSRWLCSNATAPGPATSSPTTSASSGTTAPANISARKQRDTMATCPGWIGHKTTNHSRTDLTDDSTHSRRGPLNRHALDCCPEQWRSRPWSADTTFRSVQRPQPTDWTSIHSGHSASRNQLASLAERTSGNTNRSGGPRGQRGSFLATSRSRARIRATTDSKPLLGTRSSRPRLSARSRLGFAIWFRHRAPVSGHRCPLHLLVRPGRRRTANPRTGTVHQFDLEELLRQPTQPAADTRVCVPLS